MEKVVYDLQEERQARTMRGGNGPPRGSGGEDWLSNLSQGTRFLAKRKGTTESEVDEYVVGAKLPSIDDVFLIKNSQPYTEMRWHDTKSFSRINELRYIIEVIDGNDQQVQPRPVAGNEGPEVRLRLPKDDK